MKEITHIEIRRVQNGFVVMGVNYNVMERHMGETTLQRCSFVAQDVDTLKTLIESIITMADMKWLPTADVPMIEMMRRAITPTISADTPAQMAIGPVQYTPSKLGSNGSP